MNKLGIVTYKLAYKLFARILFDRLTLAAAFVHGKISSQITHNPLHQNQATLQKIFIHLHSSPMFFIKIFVFIPFMKSAASFKPLNIHIQILCSLYCGKYLGMEPIGLLHIVCILD